MSIPLRALIIQDSEDDTLLLVRELKPGGYDVKFKRVETAEAMTAALAGRTWDVVFADYTLPHFSGTDALMLLKKSGLDIPFIFVSGTIGEDTAVEAMKTGAHDYIMKGNFKRLLPATERELRDAEVRREHKRAEQQIRHNLERIRALHEIGLAITSSLDLCAVLEILMAKIGSLLPNFATEVWLFDRESRQLERITCGNLDEKDWMRRKLLDTPPLLKAALEQGAPLLVSNVQTDLRIVDPSFFRKHGLVSYLGVPLIAKGKVLGVITFMTREEHQFSKEESEFLATLAGQVAISIHNAQLFEQIEMRSRELSALYSVSTVVNKSLDLDSILGDVMYDILEIFHFGAARIYIFDEDSKELRLIAHEGFPKDFNPHSSYKPGQGIIGRVFETGEPLLFENIQTDPDFQRQARGKTLIEEGFHGHFSIPIGAKGKTIGAMNFVSKKPHAFSPGENQLIHSIANHVGIAIENVRLYEHTKNQAMQLERDITERKRGEAQLKHANTELAMSENALRETLSDLRESHQQLKATQSQLIQAEKLESVGTLAAGVAHEVKNPLAVILQGIHYLSKHLPTDGNNVAMALQDMGDAIKRADSVVKGLLDFSAPSELSLNTVGLNSMVEQSLLLVKHELDKCHVKIVKEFSKDLPPVMLDKSKIEQLFVNIFLNAVHAMPRGGTLTVKTYTKELTEISHNAGSRIADHFKIGETVVMAEIEDTGTGIPKDKLTEIFDPFFTTKATGKGTGLGLTVTKKIIDLHGGTIDIGNRKEGGARVTIMFKA